MQPSSEEVRSICPKCGREGRQDFIHPHKNDPNYTYLRMVHGSNDVCYVGRIRRPGEGLGLLNKPQSLKDYEKAMDDIAKHLRELADYYSKSKSGSAVKFSREVQDILMGYGY
jgi:hypothetical protein